MEWYLVPRDEQETVININYYEKTITVYTSRKQTAERLLKKIGEPTRIDSTNGLITGVSYTKNLFDKDASKFFSKGLMIGVFRKQNNSDNEND